jgi:hypothetical protein
VRLPALFRFTSKRKLVATPYLVWPHARVADAGQAVHEEAMNLAEIICPGLQDQVRAVSVQARVRQCAIMQTECYILPAPETS